MLINTEHFIEYEIDSTVDISQLSYGRQYYDCKPALINGMKTRCRLQADDYKSRKIPHLPY